MKEFLIKNVNSLFLIFIFLCIPFTCTFIMSGEFLKHPLFGIIWIIISVVSIVISIFSAHRELFSRIILLTLLIFATFCRCVPVYVYEYRGADKLVAELGDVSHSFSGYVCRQGSNTGEGLYTEIVLADGKPLERRVTAYCINRSGHFLPEGSYVQFDGVLKNPKSYSESFDFASWLHSKGVHCELYGVYEIIPESGLDKTSLGSKLKELLYHGCSKMLRNIPGKENFENSSALAKALMFGDKSGFTDEALDSFNKCGMSHLLCVSGLHFTLIISAICSFISLFVKRKPARIIIIAIFSLMYLSMCGFSKSALRAAIMALITFSGILIPSKNSGTEKLLIAISIICLADPYSIYDTGFRLSVLSCGGITCASHFIETMHQRLCRFPVIILFTDIMSMSIGAFALTVPYMFFAFNGVSSVSVITSILTVIPAEICLALAWLSAPFASLEPVLVVFSSVYSRLSSFIFYIAKTISSLKYSYLPVNLPDFSLKFFFVSIFALGICIYSRKRCRKIFFLAFIFSLVSVIISLVYNSAI